MIRAACATSLAVAALCAPAPACDPLSPPPVTDTPDAAFEDTNGDGIDGMRCGPVFVAPTGTDWAAGTIEQPMRTISAAILRASRMTPVRDVYVSSNGTYNENLWVISGVNVYGGYDHTNGWSRSARKAVIQGGVLAGWGQDINAPTTLDSLDLRAAENSAPGGHSVALRLLNGTAQVTLANCSIKSGNAGSGTEGERGEAGRSGSSGRQGGKGSCDDNGSGAPGGAGGDGAQSGASGGRGGSSDSPGNGSTGNSVAGGGARGGAGGAGGNPGQPGQSGEKGRDGVSGFNGTAGSNWYGSGGDGSTGTNGYGGAGGGGGGGQHCTFCDNGQGNGGGGGGGGGWGGAGGKGGTYAGSSYGVIVTNTTLHTSDSTISSGNGGRGGAGGWGGSGGSGGYGGPGGNECPKEVGVGGSGGNGGKGGAGGYGGGGGGGNAVAVLLETGGRATRSGGTWSYGMRGFGGSSFGAKGADGAADSTATAPASFPLPVYVTPFVLGGFASVPKDADTTRLTPVIAGPKHSASHTLQILSQPGHGLAVLSGTSFQYRPAAGYSGWDTVRLRATSTQGWSVDGYFTIYVAPPFSLGDVANALRIAGGLTTRTADDVLLDANGDGVVTTEDAVMMLRQR